MRIFLLTFFGLYGALHYYIFTKIHAAFHPGLLSVSLLGLFLFLMVCAPLIIIDSERHGYETFARISGYAGFMWMGFAFLFFACSLGVEIYRLVAFTGGFIAGKDLPSPGALWRFLIPFVFGVCAATYGFFEAEEIRTERIVIRTAKVPKEFGSLKIAQISDVHLGILVREDRLKKILTEVRRAAPDILISSGDLVDGQMARLHHASALLDEVKPRLGKFAITGNHEFYAGLPQSLEFTRRGGFSLLRGESVTVGRVINIAGIDDFTAEGYGGMRGLPEKELLSRLPRDKFTLFLKHRPVVEKGSLGLFDLQVSGHTHKGQIFPFRLLTRIAFPFSGGFFPLPNRAFLYVSRGSGTWGPPIRFLTPPEVTVYEIIPEDQTKIPAPKASGASKDFLEPPVAPILQSLTVKKGGGNAKSE